MEENLITRDEAQNTVDNTQYIEALNEMKKNSVSKDQYDRLKEENAKLIKSLIEGNPVVVENVEEPVRSRKECLKDFNSSFDTNLDYWKNQLELRKATIKEYGKDPCANGSYGLDIDGQPINQTQQDLDDAQEVADVIEDLIKESNGDPIEFSHLLKRAAGIR